MNEKTVFKNCSFDHTEFTLVNQTTNKVFTYCKAIDVNWHPLFSTFIENRAVGYRCLNELFTLNMN